MTTPREGLEIALESEDAFLHWMDFCRRASKNRGETPEETMREMLRQIFLESDDD